MMLPDNWHSQRFDIRSAFHPLSRASFAWENDAQSPSRGSSRKGPRTHLSATKGSLQAVHGSVRRPSAFRASQGLVVLAFSAGIAFQSQAATADAALPPDREQHLEPVVVTGNKRREHLLDVPSSVWAATEQALHRALARDFDLVLVDGRRGSLLPAGPLREGSGALRRADAVPFRCDGLRVTMDDMGSLSSGIALRGGGGGPLYPSGDANR